MRVIKEVFAGFVGTRGYNLLQAPLEVSTISRAKALGVLLLALPQITGQVPMEGRILHSNGM